MSDLKWIGFDLGGTKMMGSVVSSDMEILGSVRKATKGNEGAAKGMKRIVDVISQVLEDQDVQPEDLGGIGMACPGVVDTSRGILRRAPNLGWEDMAIGPELEEKFGVPVRILNDVDAGAFGEYAHGAAQDAGTVIAVFPGTGIGAGCIINGTLLTGKNASCMELGNTRLTSVGLNGDLGEPPRLESVCGRLGISAAATVEAYRGNAPTLLELAGTDMKEIKSGVLAKSIEGGDKAIEDIVRNAAHYLGLSIAGVVDLLGPDIVVLGGGLVEKLPDIYLQSVRNAIDQYTSPTLANEVDVREAKLGDGAVVIGAAAFAKQEVAKS